MYFVVAKNNHHESCLALTNYYEYYPEAIIVFMEDMCEIPLTLGIMVNKMMSHLMFDVFDVLPFLRRFHFANQSFRLLKYWDYQFPRGIYFRKFGLLANSQN